MKKSILIFSMIALSLTACKKDSTTVSENSTPKINSLQMDESKSYTFIANDNSRANVTFQGDGKDETITIKANNNKFVLDKKDADATTIVFERNGVEAKITKDSLHILQGNTVIALGRTN